ncbi:MAG: outer membrane beta-barrel family protein [Saprospiraceae bacterium]
MQLATGAKWTGTIRENALLSEFLEDEIWVRNDRSNAFNYQENVPAAYLSLGQKIGEKTYVEAGLRAEFTNLLRTDRLVEDVIEQRYLDWLPNLYLSHDLNDENSLALNYSKRLSRPPFFRINNNVLKITDFRFELGNPDLTPEYIHRVALDFNQKNQRFSIYLRRTVDAINGIYLLEGETAFYKPFNAGAQTNVGLSYNRYGNLTKWWYLKGSGGIFQRKFTNDEGIDSFEQLTYYFRLNNIFKLNATSSFELNARYNSRYADAFYISEQNFTIDMILQKSFFDKRLNCKIYVNDVFNILEYANSRPFDTFESRRIIKPQTRTVRLWVTYNFSNKNKLNKRTNQSKNEARRRL